MRKEVDLAQESSVSDADWFFSQNLAVFAGEWVAVLNQKIIAHGRNLKRVYEEATARAQGTRPLFYSVPSAIAGGA